MLLLLPILSILYTGARVILFKCKAGLSLVGQIPPMAPTSPIIEAKALKMTFKALYDLNPMIFPLLTPV